MFAGHYAAAFAGRAAGPMVPLWVLFIAVQFVDFIWAGFILAGIETAQIVPGFAQASNLDLSFMPYTHSFVGSLVWSVVFAGGYVLLARPQDPWLAALVTGGAVFSHWLADLLVHLPDLPIVFGEPKVGFGLWRSLLWSQVLEVGLLIAGTLWYVRVTEPKGFLGKAAPWILLAILLGMQTISHLPAEEYPSIEGFAVQALLAFTVLVVAAAFVDATRRAR
ncbi:hypothetical protein [Parvularcula lutaonensis]|uniref:Metal-dependent hydrolase n=1 Tax=Parvularcula lutaonensis TaxID=491923 RepID=A0ABV7MCU4_9PROT|nr:hypothetical protein [Parvularcula lutaonensis]GGY38920.1 hypothetical protein GCM10007148_04050 [Parvularcula lutaonensis]